MLRARPPVRTGRPSQRRANGKVLGDCERWLVRSSPSSDSTTSKVPPALFDFNSRGQCNPPNVVLGHCRRASRPTPAAVRGAVLPSAGEIIATKGTPPPPSSWWPSAVLVGPLPCRVAIIWPARVHHTRPAATRQSPNAVTYRSRDRRCHAPLSTRSRVARGPGSNGLPWSRTMSEQHALPHRGTEALDRGRRKSTRLGLRIGTWAPRTEFTKRGLILSSSTTIGWVRGRGKTPCTSRGNRKRPGVDDCLRLRRILDRGSVIRLAGERLRPGTPP